MENPTKALIFDVDGTLSETEELHRKAFNLAFKEDNKYVSELKKMRSKFDKRLKNLGLKVGK